jgi:ABC-type Fe3+/spermidine/putrescine transport system ATPase subunit
MSGYNIVAGFLIFFFVFIYFTWFGTSLKIENDKEKNYDIKIKQEIYLSIKSESIDIIKKNKTEKSISKNNETINGTVSEITFLGQFVRYLVVLNNGKEIQVRTNHEVKGLKLKDNVSLSWNINDFLLHQN